MHLTWGWVSWCALGAWLWPLLALAQHPSSDAATWLTVRADTDPCIRAADLAADVEQALGSSEPPAGVRVLVEADGESWRFVLQHGSGAVAQRELTDLPRTCAARREALTLVLVLAIEHALAKERAADAEEVTVPPEQPSTERAPPPSTPPPSRARTVGVRVGLEGGTNVGLLPRPAAEGGLLAELSLGDHLALVLGGHVTSRTRSALADGELVARYAGGSLNACAGGRSGIGPLYGCVGAGLGAVLGKGSGLSRNDQDTTFSGTLELGMAGRVPLARRLLLLWRLAAFVQWLRPRYQALTARPAAGEQSDIAATRTFPPAGGRLLLGLAWQIR